MSNVTPDAIAGVIAQANLRKEEGNFSAAESMLQQSFRAGREHLGECDPVVLSAMSNLGALYVQMGRPSDALPFCTEVVELRRDALGSTHEDTLSSIHNLATLLQTQGRLDESAPLRKEFLEGTRAAKGDRDKDTLSAQVAWGGLLAEQDGKLEEAMKIFTDVLTTYVSIYGRSCGGYIPKATAKAASSLFERVMKEPNLGADLAGYQELADALRAALAPRT